jgi:A/G-specific adenine glycosylase
MENAASLVEAEAQVTDHGWRRQIRRRLLGWFARNQRDLPWRKNRDPYRIWVSEVMLQQTQVATVVPYFERFMAVLPTLDALARASEQDVLRLWEGLGYYRRARNLHQAAQRLHAAGGELPDDPAVVGDLPGVGRYILGAVLSQAFDRRLPILEANSERVLARLFGIRADVRRGPMRRWLWRAAETLLPAHGAGNFNQALMELGALVCTSPAPECSACPIAEYCRARRLGLQDELPLRAAALPVILIQEAGVVIRRGRRVLLVQRPSAGRWADLWEFPHDALQTGETHEACARRVVCDLTGVQAVLGPELLTLQHAVTRHHITLVCFQAQHRTDDFRSPFYQAGRWVEPAALANYPVSAPQRQLAQAVAEERQRRLF